MHPKVFFPAPSPNPALIPSTQPNTILPREDPLQTFYRSYSQCHSYTYFEGAESLEKNKKIELELNSIIYIPRIRRDDNNPQGKKRHLFSSSNSFIIYVLMSNNDIFEKKCGNNRIGDKDQERERDLDKEREKDQDREWSRGFDGRGRASFANRRGTRGRFPGGPRRFPGRYSRYASGIIEISKY